MAVYIKEGVAIIGAGPGGLAMAGRLTKRGIPFTVFEKSDNVAQSWRNHYDRLCLHTVKSLSHLPYVTFPENYPVYVPRDKLVKYYEDYSAKFEIYPKLEHELTRIERTENSWKLSFSNGEKYIFKKVVLATGVNRCVNHPKWEGDEEFQGKIIHSREYLNPSQFKDKRVLVIGMGNTGAEIALDLAKNGIQTTISVRDKVLVVPRDIFGTPSQITANRLKKLPSGIGDWLGNTIRKLIIGNLRKYGLESNPNAPVKHLRETGRTPVMDLGTIELIKKGIIKVIRDVKSFYEKGITTLDGKNHSFDSVILATGYKACLNEFLELPDDFLDDNRLPKDLIGSGELSGLYFLGYDNYQIGGILGAIYRDSEVIANKIYSERDVGAGHEVIGDR